MIKTEDWKAHVEAHKFTGPTIKLLHLGENLFAVLDHEYNLKHVVHSSELPFICTSLFEHPPQRERPKPVVNLEEYREKKPALNIDLGDIDL